jgi:hypothetical protein
MMAAITIYVVSDDLSFFPRGHRQQPVTDAIGNSGAQRASIGEFLMFQSVLRRDAQAGRIAMAARPA